MSFSKYLRRNMYRWHRNTGMIVALPVMLWTISGFLHPVLNSHKPQVRNQALPSIRIDTSRISVPLQAALVQNHIATITGFRVVKLYEVFYYQVHQPHTDTATYINCASGTVLLNGDRNYAAYLAQRFLSEEGAGRQQGTHHEHGSEASLLPVSFTQPKEQLPERARVLAVTMLRQYDAGYKPSNKILPVYKVRFSRADSIRLYIDTRADRLALATDTQKEWASRFFAATHTWSFLNSWGKGRNLLLGSFSALCFLSGIMGFYVYNIARGKKSKGRQQGRTVKNTHRVLSNLFLLTTLLFAFSGAWHSFRKLDGKTTPVTFEIKPQIATTSVNADIQQLQRLLPDGAQLSDVSVVQMDGSNYWRLSVLLGAEKQIKYVQVQTLQLLADGDNKYGCYLACAFSGKAHSSITYQKCLTSFNHQYSMMNKQLPVQEIGFDNGETYFVETSTGTLSAISNAASRSERFSFANLHMHHYWEMWLGKGTGTSIRNGVLMATTLGLIGAAITGMLMYLQRKRKQSTP